MSASSIVRSPHYSPPPIAMMTDFGLSDGYVGAMKGVILDILPWVQVVDVTHEIAPQNVRQAAFVLQMVAPFFPKATVFLVVVDPGVGTRRRAIAVFTDRGVFVGPDNGVFSWIFQHRKVYEIRELANPSYMRAQVSATFHGRDIFAPFAAHIAAGVPASSIGPVIHDPVSIDLPEPQAHADGHIVGEVIHIDAFGNLITNIREEHLAEGKSWRFEIAGESIDDFCRAYGFAQEGQLVALIGSLGYLEIAVRNGHAARRLNGRLGMPVIAKIVSHKH